MKIYHVAVAFGALCALVAAVVMLSPEVKTVPKTVTSFNEGFRDSKYDDCQQGFQPACEWLKVNR